MHILIAADHAGFALKEKLVAALNKRGFEVSDYTTKFKEGDDYPLVAESLVTGLTSDTKHRNMGILVCGSGVGVCIAANRHKGIRAVAGHGVAEVEMAREHNDVNTLCLSGNETTLATALKMIDAFIKTKTSSAARHKRRIKELG